MKKISRIKSYVDSLESEQLIGDKGFMLFCGGSLIMDSVMAVEKNKHNEHCCNDGSGKNKHNEHCCNASSTLLL